MPCDSSYMDANRLEIELSRVMCLIGELEGEPINPNHWRGYHPAVYPSKLSRADGDKLVAALCAKLQQSDPQLYSLEMQMWWRDHQEADRLRVRKELAVAADEAARAEAMAKLTVYERRLLGLS